ncbi:MAG: L-aspartate oxidase [Hyphomonadaceae bacterium]|nr:L-aspartate oxidase [Hyphomonadaceae bacterium]
MRRTVHSDAVDQRGDAGDVLIIGAGLAGLFLALKLAPRACTVLTPAPLGQSASSAWAQGGLAAALSPEDSPEAHAADTVAAGAGLVDPVIARLIAEEGPARVRDLLELGVPFDRSPDGALSLSLEAAHSFPRVARVAGDLAGRAIMDALVAAVAANPHITVIEGAKAVALLQDSLGRVAGVITTDKQGASNTLVARETVLCTGGSGGLFEVTTNPPSARGDALAMAIRAGALLADLEFVQFHPTAMDVGRDPAPLATEALRGDGAILRNADGSAFMARYHEMAELAPRDEVARAIHTERMAGRGAFLDAREAVGAHFPEKFPTVFAACQATGFDPREAPIPIAPAAHYHMGGIISDFWGASSLDGLSVCGECASTGAHGANRLASNSLLEAVVFAHRIAERLREGELKAAEASHGEIPPELDPGLLEALRTGMQAECGVVRTSTGLTSLTDQIYAFAETAGPANELVCAGLIVSSALAREESRGGHYRSDFPEPGPVARRQFRHEGTLS